MIGSPRMVIKRHAEEARRHLEFANPHAHAPALSVGSNAWSSTDHAASGMVIGAMGWMIAALATALIYWLDVIPSVQLGIIFLMFAFGWSILRCNITNISPLGRLMVLLYSAPFFACIGYLIEPQFVWWASPAAASLCRDEIMNGIMVWTALIGLLAMTAGLRCGPILAMSRTEKIPNRFATSIAPQWYESLTGGMFLMTLGCATMLAWLAAPDETILSARYGFGQTVAAAAELRFDGASLLSSIILGMLFVDTQRDLNDRRRRGKLIALSVISTYIVVNLQLMRGDRGCAGLLIAAAVMYITSHQGAMSHWWQVRKATTLRAIKVSIPLGAAAFAFLLLGFLRFMLSDGNLSAEDLSQIQRDVILDNTWTSVALNNLGLAVEQTGSSIQYLKGQTYADYFLSLPPGFVSRTLGLVRPVDIGADPRFWYEGLSTGGMHPAIVPFKNFGPFGVVAVLFIYGTMIGFVESFSGKPGKYQKIVYIGFFCFAFEWFWYGDMNLIRGLMAVGFACLISSLGSQRFLIPRTSIPSH
jgi:hypothetical protein